jgi:hypothetical protein
MENKKIMLVGASGTGKTTLAKYISEKYAVPFISGSSSDLVPELKELSHIDMLSMEERQLWENEFKILRARGEAFTNYDNFVTDRSFIDNMAYCTFKCSKFSSKELMDSFFEEAEELLKQNCTDLIFLSFGRESINKWDFEPNGKRILNGYFQWMISAIMDDILIGKVNHIYGQTHQDGLITSQMSIIDVNFKKIKVLHLYDLDLEVRKDIIDNFLNQNPPKSLYLNEEA